MTLASSPHSTSAGSRVEESALRAQISDARSSVPPEQPSSRRSSAAGAIRVMSIRCRSSRARRQRKVGRPSRTRYSDGMDVIEFLALECPFLLPAARKNPSKAAVLQAFDDAVALSPQEAGRTLYPGTSAGDAAGWTRTALRELIEGYFRRQ